MDKKTADDAQTVDQRPLLSEAVRRQVLEEWNAAAADYPQDKCVHELFEAQAARTPDAIAAVHEDTQLTYAELNAKANRLAHYLRTLGVQPDALVALCSERSLDMVVGLLAILKAGGAYVPLDPAYPAERLAYMLKDSAPVAVLTYAQVRLGPPAGVGGAAAGVPVIDLAHAERWAAQPDSNPNRSSVGLTSRHLAYVIYTSGSTGNPKGVMVEHGNIVRLLAATEGWFHFDEKDVWTLFHSLAFDFSVWEIWGALTHGGQLLIVPQITTRSPQEFYRLLQKERVTVLNQTPNAFLHLIAAQRESKKGHWLRHVIFGGEALDAALLKPWYQDQRNRHTRLTNMYGITETTVHVTCCPLEPTDTEKREGSRIGRPIPDLKVYILDGHREPVPIGVAGEMYVSGAGVARGYLNRPELNTERFVADPFAGAADARMYKSGDLGRYLPDGEIEFLGRNDFQVKIRGFRIELGEIEAVLKLHPAVREAVVLAREDGPGEKWLAAYYTVAPDAEAADAEALRRHLSAALPEYMVPAAYVRLDALPLTANGKLDRRALPPPDGTAYAARGYEAPAGEIELHLARIWADVLKLERVGRRDHFFELGGHSLKAVRVISRLRQALGVEVVVAELFARPVLAEFAEAVREGARSTLPPITVAGHNEPLPLSFAQQRLWFLAQMEGVSQAYHIPLGLRLTGALDGGALRCALDRLVARHEGLRTTFSHADGQPVQRIAAENVGFGLREHDLRQHSDAEGELQRLAIEEANAAFDLQAGPLVRGRLVRLGDSEHVLLITMHHIVSDGWSMGVLTHELGTLYRAYSQGQADPLPALVIQYPDYAVWERRWLTGEVLQAQTDYWQCTLAGAPAVLDLPTDRRRPIQQDYAGAFVALELDDKLTAGLKALSRRHGTTLFMTLLAGWAALLTRLAGQDDVVIGTPVANRSRTEVEPLIGFFVNSLALRLDLSAGPTVGELLQRVKARTLEAQQHQDLPFEQVVEIVRPPRNLAYAPVFQVMFAWQNTDQTDLELQGLTVAPVRMPCFFAKFDLTLSLAEFGGCIVGGLEYATALFDRATVEHHAGYLRKVLAAMVADGAQAVQHLPLLSEAEQWQVLEEWNATAADYPQDKCVHELFEAQAARTPDAIAVVHKDVQLTYAELNAKANRLAHHLRTLGVQPDARVAICVERSIEMAVGILGILKAGAAYVPLDPANPRGRLVFMIEEVYASVVVTRDCAHESLPVDRCRVVTLNGDWNEIAHKSCENPFSSVAAHNLAYVLFTSGTTGNPKAVAMPHRSLTNLLGWQCCGSRADKASRTLQFAPLSFDVSFQEIFSTWCSGGTLFLISEEIRRDPVRVLRFVSENRITRLFVPLVMLRQLAELAQVESAPKLALQEVITAGEQLRITPEIACWFKRLKSCVLENQYGPTESHVVAAYRLTGSPREWPPLPPVGRPIDNIKIRILDTRKQLVPAGVCGEIYIGGAGVARGYLNRPELTAERFLADPFANGPGARMYRTGDLGRYLPDGTIEFLGRNDFQVKIRGFRIEPGEIEAKLAQHPAVREAVVVAREDGPGDKRLVAYYTVAPDAEAADAEALRRHLSAALPEYMVPAAYVRLDALPLTANGKLDRRALPPPDGTAYAARGYEAPAGEIELHLARIWADVLKLERVGRNDHFFELGGHSLKAVRVISRLRQALGVEVVVAELFARPVLAEFAEAVREGARSTLPPITVAGHNEPLPLSFAQRRLWFLAQMEGVSQAYHIPLGLRLTGMLDGGALRRALDRLVARHEGLRTTFSHADGQPVQRIAAENGSFSLHEHDLRQHSNAEGELQRLAIEEANAAFDLQAGPLVRGRLIRLSDREHVLLITLHHIVSDGWSMGVLTRELGALYQAYSQDQADPLPALAIQYPDYAVWQRRWLTGEGLQAQSDYWRRTLAGTPAVLELPTDRRRPIQQDYAGAFVALELDDKLTAGLKALSRRHGTTLFMTLLAGWAALLTRLSGQDDVVIGTPVANRSRVEIEPLIGFFVNSLALRLDLSAGPTVGELLQRVKARTLEAQQHQDLPFEQVVEIVRPPRNLAYAPVFQVMFAWQNTDQSDLELPGLTVAPVRMPCFFAKFDLTLSLAESGGCIVGGLEYATALFDRATVEHHAGYLRKVLAAMVADGAQAVQHLPLLSEAEQWQVLEEWNATAADYPQDKCVHELFEAQAARTPDAIAVVHEDVQLTYAELNAKANRLAHHLRTLGVLPDALVALCAERSLDMVVGLLAILKAGGAYVALDSKAPSKRLQSILDDAQPKVIVVESKLQKAAIDTVTSAAGKGISDPPIIVCLEQDAKAISHESAENPSSEVTSDNLAYVCFTSGSTGRPKGVSIPHRGVARLVKNTNYIAISTSDVFLQFAPVSFDASTFEIWGCLLNGARLVVCPPGLLSLAELGSTIREHGISVLWLTAGLFHQMVDEELDSLKGVRQLLTGGDVLSVPHVRKALEALGEGRLINGYGPTENTTFTCCHAITRSSVEGRSIPIGHPISNTQCFVLDCSLQPVPMGVRGELFIGGDGLARGYLNAPELTAEKFIQNPFRPGTLLYRTGDFARYLPHGEIEFLGRDDHQVKIRGFRIELGEIEAVLKLHPAVREAVVVACEDVPGDRRLAVYVTPASAAPVVGELRRFLKERLPAHMLPSAIVFLDAIPLSPNGKADRNTLPPPKDMSRERYGSSAAPRTPTEQVLADIWSEILGLQEVRLDDNFFELGGHSLAVVRLISQVNRTLKVGLGVPEVFQNVTLEQLARVIDGRKPMSKRLPAVSQLREGRAELPVYFIYAGPDEFGLAQTIATGQPVFGIEVPLLLAWRNAAENLDISALPTMKQLVAPYVAELRAHAGSSPCVLAGFSFAGVMAFEAARQLQERGGAVEAVLLFDSWAMPPHQIAWRKLRQDWKQALKVLSADQPSQPIGSGLTTLCLLSLWILGRETRRLVREADWLLPFHTWFRSLFNRAAGLDLTGLLDEQGTPLNWRIIEQLYNKAAKTHRLRRLDCRGILFRAGPEDQTQNLTRDGSLGWENLFGEGLEIIPVPGDHVTMIREESHKLMLSRDLNEVLSRLCARLNERHCDVG